MLFEISLPVFLLFILSLYTVSTSQYFAGHFGANPKPDVAPMQRSQTTTTAFTLSSQQQPEEVHSQWSSEQ